MSPMFKDFLSNFYGSRTPLICVLREDLTVLDEGVDLLLANCYYGESGRLISELESRLPHSGHVFKNENASVYTTIEEAVHRKFVK